MIRKIAGKLNDAAGGLARGAKNKTVSGLEAVGKADQLRAQAGAAGVPGGLKEGMLSALGVGAVGLGVDYAAGGSVAEKFGADEGLARAGASMAVGSLVGVNPADAAPDIKGGVSGENASGMLLFGASAAAGGVAGMFGASAPEVNAGNIGKLPFRTKGASGASKYAKYAGNAIYSKVGKASPKIFRTAAGVTGMAMGAELMDRLLSGIANKVVGAGTPQSRRQAGPRERTAQKKTGSPNSSRMAEYGGGGANMPQPSGSMVLDLHRSGGRGAVLT